jgi:hypothetical protein
MKLSSGVRVNVRPYVEGMVPGTGPDVGTNSWYHERIGVWSDEARKQIHFGNADLAASSAALCGTYARLLGHYATVKPEDIQ